jgi:hypothetical protein
MTFGRRVGASIPRGPGLLLSAALAVAPLTACEDSRLAPKPGPEGRHVAKPAPLFTEAPSSAPEAPSAPSAIAPSGRMDEQQPPVYGAGGGLQIPGAPGTVRFVVIGDYGSPGSAEREVAELIAGLQPDFVITTGDNNYPSGSAETISAR